MHKESEIIRRICKILPPGKQQVNKPFEADCEILKHGDGFLLVSTDGFSAEDQMRENNPETLGFNLAVATISDILACGGKPLYYCHSMVVNDKWDEEYIERFSRGVKEVLDFHGTAFIGGDFGCDDKWHYTATVIGETDKILMRKGAKAGDHLYISGPVGMGNVEAVLNIYADRKGLEYFIKKFKMKFPARRDESYLIKKYATCCIDTSDGLGKSLHLLSDINSTGFEIDSIPYHKTGLAAAKFLNKPKEMLMLGECGEYELLFTISPENEAAFLNDPSTKKLNFHKIGTITENKNRIVKEGKKTLDLSELKISARDYPDVKEYISLLSSLIKKSWKEE